MVDPGGLGAFLPFGIFFFYASENLRTKIGITVNEYEIVTKCSKCHFRDISFQKLLGEHAPEPPRKVALSALVVFPPPPPSGFFSKFCDYRACCFIESGS